MSKDLAQNIEKTPQRAALKALSLSDEDISKPLIAVISALNELDASSLSLQSVIDNVKLGVYFANGTPFHMPLLSISNPISQGHIGSKYALPSREIVADSVEAMVLAHEFDGVVLVASSEETLAGMLMGIARVNVPSIVINSGIMKLGSTNSKKIGLYSAFEGNSAVRSGRMTLDELKQVENNACPSLGSFNSLYSFNSLSILCEALGMALPSSSTMSYGQSELHRLAKRTGQAIMKLVSNDMKPRMIMTKSAFLNAITVDMALGGCTNSLLHLIAIADECGVKLDLNTFQQISDKTPVLCPLHPLTDISIDDFDKSGGVMALLSELAKNDLIDKTSMTTSNKQIGKSFSGITLQENGSIRPFDDPHSPVGGLCILKGNIGDDGAVLRRSAVNNQNSSFIGKAKVFDSEEEAVTAVLDGLIVAGDVVVVRYEGPKGGPGMRSLLSLCSALSGMGLNENVALITDGRLPDSYNGVCVCHISPEATEGEKLALIKDGDKIEIDSLKGKLNLDANAKEIQIRSKKWKPKDSNPVGLLLKYSYLVTSSQAGAVLKKKF